MIRRTLPLVAVVLALLPFALAGRGQVVTPAQAHTVTVYVTRTGECYHRTSCRSLRYSRIPMRLAGAAQTYRPCRVCRPPVPEGR